MLSRLGAGRFHPELRAGSRLLPRAAVSPRLVPLLRKGIQRLPADPDFVESAVSPTAAVRVYRPAHAPSPSPALLYIHGGGLLIGSPLQDEAALRSIADELGVVVATVRYRLAPEHRYPAARDDCYDALRWLADQPGVDPTRVAIGGGSAGGGLAAATALHTRDRGGPALCLQLLVYPMLDDRTAVRPDPDSACRRLWSNEANHYGWSSYLGHQPGLPGVDPTAAPARCDDFAGLPPAWIGVGTLDLFHDEALAYAARLRAAGVACTTGVVPGAFHGFDAFAGKPVVREFRASQVAALRSGFGLD
ncbi:alpha/beta hydrolase fold domain-containing protein [Nocardioides sp. SR21]|uniref:alpha/beta hydrolase fold domain-containing protein n=1 Tax=Nocardioides sp. SR21 TaxID=2919501 RepID=UPI001FA95701|nr:alpha/beta hydrolase fold domain-containing protein [Nocardioides sp. SR21]